MTSDCLWCLWDAFELVSVHRHRADADSARADLLTRHLEDFPADHDDLAGALYVEAVRFAAPAAVTPKPGR